MFIKHGVLYHALSHKLGRKESMSLAPKYQEILKAVPLIMNLTETDLIQVVNNTIVCNLKAGETLFRQNDPATEFFYVVDGRMKISLLSIEGGEKVVDIINAGNTFAEAIIFRGMGRYPVNSEALVDSTILRINADNYMTILKESPEVCINVMRCLSERLHWLIKEIDRLSLHNATYRLISYLLDQVPSDACETTDVNLAIPKHVVASRISVSPETLSRTLKRLSKDGLLEVHDKHIVLVNPVELRRIVAI